MWTAFPPRAGAVASYTVTADIDAPENVLPGMQATVTIPRESVSGANVLPMAALSFDEDGAPCVLVDDGAGGYAQAAVETGLSDGMYVEITSGVASGRYRLCADGHAERGEPPVAAKPVQGAVRGNDRGQRPHGRRARRLRQAGTGTAGGHGACRRAWSCRRAWRLPEGMEPPEDTGASGRRAETPAAADTDLPAEAAGTAADADSARSGGKRPAARRPRRALKRRGHGTAGRHGDAGGLRAVVGHAVLRRAGRRAAGDRKAAICERRKRTMRGRSMALPVPLRPLL